MLRLQTPLDERYTAADPDDLAARIAAAKATLGDRLFILGHHYQRDEIIRWADARGDSYRLSVLAQERPQARYIVFCGVHFMAESADVLTADNQAVILPDLNAGCSMADMADIDQVEEAWEEIAGVTDIYPTTESRRSRGSISGKVTKNGGGVLGAHVVAFNPATGGLVGGFTLNEDGSFTIAGLEAGPLVLRVEPLEDGDIESFFDASLDVDLDFRVRFHDKVVVVPLGGGTRNVEIKVTPK